MTFAAADRQWTRHRQHLCRGGARAFARLHGVAGDQFRASRHLHGRDVRRSGFCGSGAWGFVVALCGRDARRGGVGYALERTVSRRCAGASADDPDRHARRRDHAGKRHVADRRPRPGQLPQFGAAPICRYRPGDVDLATGRQFRRSAWRCWCWSAFMYADEVRPRDPRDRRAARCRRGVRRRCQRGSARRRS